jgi:hypothetical protein
MQAQAVAAEACDFFLIWHGPRRVCRVRETRHIFAIGVSRATRHTLQLTSQSDLAGCNGHSDFVELRESNGSSRQTGQSEIAGEGRR